MAEPNQRTYPLTLSILGNPVPGRILINATNGDTEWFYGDDSYPTLRSTKGEKYKWNPDSSNSYYNLTQNINKQFTTIYSESEIKKEVNSKSVPELDKQRRIFYQRNAPDTGIQLGLLQDNQQTGNSDRSGIGTGSTQPLPSPAIFNVTSDQFQGDEAFKNQKWLQYPNDINNSQDRILISQKRYVIPTVLSNKKFDTSNIVAALSKERFNPDDTKENLLGTVILPMPNDISETNVTAWGEDSLSSLAALVGGTALGAAAGIASFDIDQFNKSISNAANQILTENSAAGETIRQLLSLNAAAAITKKFGININPEAFRSRITGTAINPNLELLFQGPKLRSFAFQFKMSPRNKDDARNIRYIIKFFKKGMAPKRNFTDANAAYFLGAPNVFDIVFKSGDNKLKSIGKIKTCALQQFSVNYTPDGFYAAYQDYEAGGSQPVSVTMTMAFTELTPLYNDNYEDSDTVGWDILNNGPSGIPQSSDEEVEPQSTQPLSLPISPSSSTLPPASPGLLATPAN